MIRSLVLRSILARDLDVSFGGWRHRSPERNLRPSAVRLGWRFHFAPICASLSQNCNEKMLLTNSLAWQNVPREIRPPWRADLFIGRLRKGGIDRREESCP